MTSTHVAIVGNGKTTRSNVEALIGDFSEAFDDLTLIIEMKPDLSGPAAEAAVWVDQYAQDNGIKVHYSSDVYEHISTNLKLDTDAVKFFVLWDDDDLACQKAVSYAQEHKLPVFDLTDGLVRIPTDQGKIDAPAESQMPDFETNVKEDPEPSAASSFGMPKPSTIFETMESDFPTFEDEFLEGGALIEEALEEAGTLMARAFVREMLRILKEERDGETK